MKRLILFTLLMGAVMGNAISAQKFTTRTYPLSDFTNIHVSNVVKVIYTQGNTYSVKLTGRSDRLDLMEVKSQGGTLKVYTNNGKKLNNTQKEDCPDGDYTFILELTSPCLNNINLNDVSSFEGKSLKSDGISLTFNGASTFKVDAIDCNTLNMNLNGASRIKAANIACQKIQANISGANTTDIQHLKAKEVRFTTSGASKIKLPDLSQGDTVIFNLHGASKLTLSAEVKELLHVGFYGADEAELTFKGGSLRTECKGGSKLKADVNCTSLNASCDGASRAVFKGTADKVEINQGGIANIDTSNLNQF
ncbi:MAG: DUF2807 domain-containing protein [Bacteroidaceae bacterium]|nr:DUF2807 domain-containing protein [Bacteroidaceae bacterium]